MLFHSKNPKIIFIIILIVFFVLFVPLFQGFSAKLNTPGVQPSNSSVPLKSPSSPLNVKSFNVKGDGVTDDSSNIQKALDSIKDNGAIYFPKGIYFIKQTIVIPSYFRIMGASKRSAVLLSKGTEKALAI